MGITYSSQIAKFTPLGKRKLTEWIMLVAFLEKREVASIAYVFCDNAFLLALNQQFLKHSSYTDIITFDYSDKGKIIAEIYISIDQVRINAVSYGASFIDEFRRVIIHGVLHCIGYNDKTKSGQRIMRKLEDQYLQLFSEIT